MLERSSTKTFVSRIHIRYPSQKNSENLLEPKNSLAGSLVSRGITVHCNLCIKYLQILHNSLKVVQKWSIRCRRCSLIFYRRFISGRCQVYVFVANTFSLCESFINARILITPSMSMWTITVNGQEIWLSYTKSVQGTALQVSSFWLQSKQRSFAYTSFRLILTLKSYYIYCNVKVNLPRDRPLVAQREQPLPMPDIFVRLGWVVNTTFRLLYPVKETRYSLCRRLARSVWMGAQFWHLQEFEPWNVQSMASLYTDYAIPVNFVVKKNFNSWIKVDQLDVTRFIISPFTAQHVSNVSTRGGW